MDINCDVLLFEDALVDNIKSKCVLKKKTKTFIEFCIRNEEIVFNLTQLYADRDLLDKLII